MSIKDDGYESVSLRLRQLPDNSMVMLLAIKHPDGVCMSVAEGHLEGGFEAADQLPRMLDEVHQLSASLIIKVIEIYNDPNKHNFHKRQDVSKQPGKQGMLNWSGLSDFIKNSPDDTGFLIIGWKRPDGFESCFATFDDNHLTPEQFKRDIKLVVCKLIDELPRCHNMDPAAGPVMVGVITTEHEIKEG